MVLVTSAWIESGLIRDIILFGQPYHESRYKQVLDACCLNDDLAMFEDGDSE